MNKTINRPIKIEPDIITGNSRYELENGTVINRYSHIVAGSIIGSNVMIGSFCYVANGAIIGNDVRIQNHVSVWDGVILGDHTFVGPRVCFTNHHNPEERHTGRPFVPDKTIIGNYVTLCANCTLIAPITVGDYARIGAASIVLRDIKKHEKKNGLIK